MAISLPTTNAGIVTEYAAGTIAFNRAIVMGPDGFLVAQFTANLSYSKTEFVVDANGNKVGIVQRPSAGIPFDGLDHGAIFLAPEQLAPLLGTTTDAVVFEFISNMADSLIRADLIKRGLLAE